MLTEFSSSTTTTRAVTVILTGNRPTTEVTGETKRWVALDGRLADLDTQTSPHLIPLISDNWKQYFTWRGAGVFPDSERNKLQRLVQLAHGQGRRIRFWGAPDHQAGWQELRAAGVDLINTDDLRGLAIFLSADK